MVERAVLAAVSAGCLVAAWMWGRSSRRLQRAMRRIEQASGAGADAAALARAAFNKETHTALLYAVLAIGATLILVLGRSLYYIPFLLVFAPIGVSFRYASRFLAAARLAEERSVIERRAEEVLAQEQLAPMRWSARLAPEQLPEIDGFEVGTLYEPGTGAMAGDFYDLYPSGRGRLAAVIGDVSGHGIDPSITAFQVKYLLRVFLRQYRDPAQAMEELNAVMSSQPHTEELVSLCAVVFDQSAGTLRYASAGHLHQPRGRSGPRRRPAAVHRRPGRGPRRREPLRRGAGGEHPAARPRPRREHPVQDAARRRPRVRRPALRRRHRHPGRAPHVTAEPTGPSPSEPAALAAANERALAGNRSEGADKLARQNKLFVRERLALLLDPGSLVEDGLLANASDGSLPADGVVTGTGTVDGRRVCVMANDPTVKAGSWGARTVEKIVRLTEYALDHELPVFWLVDSAGARITDQVELFPGRRGAGRIFYNQVRLSGRVPQICCLFGPSAAGGAYIPAF